MSFLNFLLMLFFFKRGLKKGDFFYTVFKMLPLSNDDMKGIPKNAIECSMTECYESSEENIWCI